MVLLRHLLGDVLRRLRQRQGRTLREVSASARVSLGYLSEVERGQKEASSELLAAICTALNTPLSHVLGEVSDSFALAELQNEAELQSEPVLASAGASRSGQSRRGGAVRGRAVRGGAVPDGPAPAGARGARTAASGRAGVLRPGAAPGPGRACPGDGLRAGHHPGRHQPGSPRLRRGHPAGTRSGRHGSGVNPEFSRAGLPRDGSAPDGQLRRGQFSFRAGVARSPGVRSPGVRSPGVRPRPAGRRSARRSAPAAARSRCARA